MHHRRSVFRACTEHTGDACRSLVCSAWNPTLGAAAVSGIKWHWPSVSQASPALAVVAAVQCMCCACWPLGPGHCCKAPLASHEAQSETVPLDHTPRQRMADGCLQTPALCLKCAPLAAPAASSGVHPVAQGIFFLRMRQGQVADAP